MEIWKFVLAIVRNSRISHFVVCEVLGALFVLARDVLRPFGVIVGGDAAEVLRSAGLFVCGSAILLLFVGAPRR